MIEINTDFRLTKDRAIEYPSYKVSEYAVFREERQEVDSLVFFLFQNIEGVESIVVEQFSVLMYMGKKYKKKEKEIKEQAEVIIEMFRKLEKIHEEVCC